MTISHPDWISQARNSTGFQELEKEMTAAGHHDALTYAARRSGRHLLLENHRRRKSPMALKLKIKPESRHILHSNVGVGEDLRAGYQLEIRECSFGRALAEEDSSEITCWQRFTKYSWPLSLKILLIISLSFEARGEGSRAVVRLS
jgi:hypothetical protein